MVWLRQGQSKSSDVDPEVIPFEEGLISTVDRQLQELGFANLCSRIANKLKDEVEKIAVEQKEIRTKFELLDKHMDSLMTNNGICPDKTPAVIIIDDDDDDETVKTTENKVDQGSNSTTPTATNKQGLPESQQALQQAMPVQGRRNSSSLTQKFILTSQGVYSSSETITRPVSTVVDLTSVPSTRRQSNGSVEEPVASLPSVASTSTGQQVLESTTSKVTTALRQKASLLFPPTVLESVSAATSFSVPGNMTVSATNTGSSKNNAAHSAELPTVSQVTSTVEGNSNWLQVSTPVARKRPGMAVSQEQPSQKQMVMEESVTTTDIDKAAMKLRSQKVPNTGTSGQPVAANDSQSAAGKKSITFSDPILKLTPIPIPVTSQPQAGSSESSSKTTSPSESPASTPHSASPMPEAQGSKNLCNTGHTQTDVNSKVQDATKAKKSGRYVIKFREGLQVLGKPEKSDMWYPGIIEKVATGRKGQERFLVKFDSKNNKAVHAQLPVNHLAPVFYPDARDLEVGSRVVATRPGDTVDSRLKNKYKDIAKAKADILFGGIIAELACEENRNRYLIFFDDGFAQYLSLRKLRHVVYASSNVWEDVSVNCKDFCKEYLQEFPYRPMVKLKAGETIQTEWNGKWLMARIISLDGSLVKVLFNIDQRTEWIYRGSTRLEPLYTELDRRDQHAALIAIKNGAKGKQKKKGKGTGDDDVSEFLPNPRIEDKITKPTFGVSKYSSKDPEGKEQWKVWDKEMTLREKEAYAAKSLGLQRITTGSSQKADAELKSQSEASGSSQEASQETNVSSSEVAQLQKSDQMETGVEGTDAEATPVAERAGNEKEVAPLTAPFSSVKPPTSKQTSAAAEITTSAVRASRSLRGKTPVIPYGAAAKEAEATWEAPWLKPRKRSHVDQASVSKVPTEEPTQISTRNRNAASLLQEKLSRTPTRVTPDSPPSDSDAVTTVFHSLPRMRGPHKCSEVCCPASRLPDNERRKHNPLLIPLLCGWMRETAKRRPGYRRDVYYRTPCYRRLRSLSNVTQYLLETKTETVTIDQFCFDPAVSCREFNPKMLHPRAKIEDLSSGKETVQISCVNENTNEYPPVVEYVSKTIAADGVNVTTDKDFLVCCDCTDLCQDKSKCACCQLTVAASAAVSGVKDENAGYSYRRLSDCVTAGIYECNARCSCRSSCFNRVVQNGIRARLQIFMTANKGWGLRCLDDIAKGAFICSYAGQILTEEMANKEGKDFGDEYLAELDHIEVVEQAKEGYESDVPELRDNESGDKMGSALTSSDGSSKDDDSYDDDTDGYTSTTDSSESDDSFQPELDDIEPLLKKKKLDQEAGAEWPEDATGTDSASKETGCEIIDLTMDSDDELEKCKTNFSQPSSKPKMESSLQNIIRRLVTCVNESKRAAEGRSGSSLNFVTGKLRNSDSAPRTGESSGNRDESKGESDDTKMAESTSVIPKAQKTTSEDHGEEEVRKTRLPDQSQEIIGNSVACPDTEMPSADGDYPPKHDVALSLGTGEGGIHKIDCGSQVTSASVQETAGADQKQNLAKEIEKSKVLDSSCSTDLLSEYELKSEMLTSSCLEDIRERGGATKIDSKARGNSHSDVCTSLGGVAKSDDDVLTKSDGGSSSGVVSKSDDGNPPSVVSKSDDGDSLGVVSKSDGRNPSGVVSKSDDGNPPSVVSKSDDGDASGVVSKSYGGSSSVGATSSEGGSLSGIVSKEESTGSTGAASKNESSNRSKETQASSSRPYTASSGKLITKKSSSSLASLLDGNAKTRAFALKSTGGQGAKLFSSPRSSTGGHMPRKAMSLRSSALAQTVDKTTEEGQPGDTKHVSTRLLYGEDNCYVIDAKSYGNAGRYLNHSCSPNLFVQNVFVETHDLRFPTVAFFALQNIPALQELTWDYSYDVGSVPGKVIYCRCGSCECRGRLL